MCEANFFGTTKLVRGVGGLGEDFRLAKKDPEKDRYNDLT